MKNSVLVVAAHPDDEVLGCGGTLLRHVAQGDQVHIMILAEGLTSRAPQRDVKGFQAELDALHQNAQRVAKALGAKSIGLFNFPDNRMDHVDLLDVVKVIEGAIDEFSPEIVYTHHAGDVNIDHLQTHNAVVTACRSLPGQSVRELYFFETPSSTEWQMQTSDKVFLPTLYVDIAEVFEKKIKTLELYASEMRDYPHARSYKAVEILARFRGYAAGLEFAEAFSVGRIIR